MSVPPHLAFLAALSKGKAEYVAIGLMAINHYAEGASQVFHTEDLDVLLPPRPAPLRRACAALAAAGYELSSNGEPLGPVDAFLAKRIVDRRAVVRARHEHGLGVDLVLEARPFTFAQWRRRSRVFRVDDVGVRCGALDMLLAAKKEAGRPKDRAFLKMYAAHREPLK